MKSIFNLKKVNENHHRILHIRIFELVYNPGHNILELYNILVKIRFTTSKTKLDIWHSKVGTRVAPRVAERLKTYDLSIFADGGAKVPTQEKKT